MQFHVEPLGTDLRNCAFRGGRCVHHWSDERKSRCAAARRAEEGRRARERAPAEAPLAPLQQWQEDWY